MKRDEWESIALLIENCWRGKFDETASSSYFALLGRFDFAISAANPLTRFADRSNDFRNGRNTFTGLPSYGGGFPRAATAALACVQDGGTL